MKQFISLSDTHIVCADCQKDFVWTGGEKLFMERLKEEGKIEYVIPPRRCPVCRAKMKREKENNNPK